MIGFTTKKDILGHDFFQDMSSHSARPATDLWIFWEEPAEANSANSAHFLGTWQSEFPCGFKPFPQILPSGKLNITMENHHF